MNAGVAKVVCGDGTTSMPAEEFEVAKQMLREAGITLENENEQRTTNRRTGTAD